MRKIAVIAVALATIFGVLHSPPVIAQSGEERITLSPAVARPEFNAGESAAGKLTIINNGSTGYEFLVYARPFSVSGEQYDPNYTEINERTEAYQWVSFEKTQFRLEAGESVEVAYTIQVPAGAASGGHYAVLFAETQPPIGSANVARKKRVGSLLYMTIAGSINLSGSLESWEAPFWQKGKPPLTSTVRVKNNGNTHFQADLHATYTNILGRKQFELNQELLVLPGTTRRIPIMWENAPTLGIFKAAGTISYLDRKEELPAKYILLLPMKVIAIFVGIILAVIAYLLLKKRKNSKQKSIRFGKHR